MLDRLICMMRWMAAEFGPLVALSVTQGRRLFWLRQRMRLLPEGVP
jgi:hypothetical protein